jgi:hypothetical protein
MCAARQPAEPLIAAVDAALSRARAGLAVGLALPATDPPGAHPRAAVRRRRAGLPVRDAAPTAAERALADAGAALGGRPTRDAVLFTRRTGAARAGLARVAAALARRHAREPVGLAGGGRTLPVDTLVAAARRPEVAERAHPEAGGLAGPRLTHARAALGRGGARAVVEAHGARRRAGPGAAGAVVGPTGPASAEQIRRVGAGDEGKHEQEPEEPHAPILSRLEGTARGQRSAPPQVETRGEVGCYRAAQ